MGKSQHIRDLEAFAKIVCLGTVDKRASVFCKIVYNNKGNLSITGVVGPFKSGNAYGSCGQINGMVIDNPNTKEGWTPELIAEFYKIWQLWHLNDMQAGCEHQRAKGWNKDGYDKHPAEPCPVCDYRYGSSWLRKEIPYRVVLFLKHHVKATVKAYAWV